MDRLPLVQALTQAGLERSGAEAVATALGEAIGSSVVTKADLAREVARLESVTSSGAVSLRHDLVREVARLELAMQSLETRLTFRLGGIIVAAMGALLAVLRFTGHAP